MVGTSDMDVAFSSWIRRSTLGGIEAAHHHLLEPVQGGALRASPAVGVEQRDGVQFDAGLVVVERGGDARACAGRACDARA